MDLNRDELRRQLRDIDRAHRATEADQRTVTSALFEDVPADQRVGVLLSGVDRRGFFRIGGLAVAATAVLAACRDTTPKVQLPVSGSTPGYRPLKDKPITDVALLRTATSLEWSVIDAYTKLLDNGYIEDPALADVLMVFADHHRAHAAVFGAATAAAGGTACTQLNAKITGDLIDPLISLVRDSGPGRAEDAKALAHALENLAAATYQNVVPIFSQPALRQAAMSVGAVEAKHAALLAAILNPTQLTAVPPSSTPSTTVAGSAPTAITANSIIAVPGAFGSLAPIPLTIGPANENGVRKTTNIETPSLNSFSYEDEAC